MKKLGYLVAGALSACTALTACAHEQWVGTTVASAQPVSSSPAPAPKSSEASASARGCPMQTGNGVSAVVSDRPDGAAITFSSSSDGLTALRSGMRAMDQANSRQGDAFAACPCILESGLTSRQALPPGNAATATTTSSATTTNREAWLYEGSPTTVSPASPIAPAEEQDRGRTMMQPVTAVPADTFIDDTPSGGVLRFRAKDPSQVQALREEVRQNVQAMARGCTATR